MEMSFGILSLIAILGLLAGKIKIKGIGVGIGAVLFAGILVGHFTHEYHVALSTSALTLIMNFGLILFVYTIGIQVGPKFFSSFRGIGLTLNLLAIFGIILSCLITVAIYVWGKVSLPASLGIYSGAITNIPALVSSKHVLLQLGIAPSQLINAGTGLSITYPFGILGVIFAMIILNKIFKISLKKESDRYIAEKKAKASSLKCCDIQLINEKCLNQSFKRLFSSHSDITLTRYQRDGNWHLPEQNDTLHRGDILRIVGKKRALASLLTKFNGQVFEKNTSIDEPDLDIKKITVTNETVLGYYLQHLLPLEHTDIVVSRLTRGDEELLATQTRLKMGDVVTVIGTPTGFKFAQHLFGNSEAKLRLVPMLPIFIGIGLGVLLGAIAIPIPGLPIPLKLGVADGPLVVAVILAHFGNIGKIYWRMPISANIALRDIGLVLFFAVVGLEAGANFVQALIHGPGLWWFFLGIFVTLLPTLIVGLIARLYLKLNYFLICGLLAGMTTNPPALSFMSDQDPNETDATVLSYALVFPLSFCLRILTPQIMAILIWHFAH